MSKRKAAISSSPRAVCATSGWNCTAKIGLSLCSMPATGELALAAVTTNPGGGASTWSPWLIQTAVSSPLAKPWKSRPPWTVTIARPYSRRLACTTCAPAIWAITCIP